MVVKIYLNICKVLALQWNQGMGFIKFSVLAVKYWKTVDFVKSFSVIFQGSPHMGCSFCVWVCVSVKLLCSFCIVHTSLVQWPIVTKDQQCKYHTEVKVTYKVQHVLCWKLFFSTHSLCTFFGCLYLFGPMTNCNQTWFIDGTKILPYGNEVKCHMQRSYVVT